jgi:O-antigen ligase
VFGVGFGQYGAESAWFVRSSPATSSHDEYLSILAEQGLLGVAIFGTLAGLVIVRIGGGGRWSRGVGLAPLAAFAAGWLIIEPLASLQTSGLIWLVVGAAGAAATVTVPAPAAVPERAAKEITRPRRAIAVRALAQ